MRWLKIVTVVVIALAVGITWMMVDVRQVRQASLPQVEIHEGTTPKYEVKVRDVQVGLEERQIKVPKVEITNEPTEIRVPSVEVVTPSDE